MRQPVVVMVAAEAVPFAQTGGLADVVGALGAALKGLGCQVVTIMPRYRAVSTELARPTHTVIEVPVGKRSVSAGVWRATGQGRVPYYLLDIPAYYDRASLYGEKGTDYPDNLERFTALNRGALELLKTLGLRPDILHVHDWQASLVPVYLRSIYRRDPFFQKTRSVLTIHNLSYQGRFDLSTARVTGLSKSWITPGFLEYFGELRLLKGGIVTSDWLTTVSPTYEREIMTPAFGCGFDGILRSRRRRLRGILNGIDARAWDPATDTRIPARFTPGHIQGKGRCRRAVLAELGLPTGPEEPLFGVVSRLVEQKGMHLLVETLPELLRLGTRWCILGSGDPSPELELARLTFRYPGRLAMRLDFDQGLARRIYAGSDYLMMPSIFEPCGLSQMYGLRYGAVPVVRRVGGLSDTVTDLDDPSGEGTGFVFEEPTPQAVVEAVRRAIGVYRNRKIWPALRRRCMEQDFSWRVSARSYFDLYGEALSAPRARIPPGR